jgi:hypothetical protein
VIRVIFDVQQDVEGLIFDLPIQQVKSAPTGSFAPRATQYQQRPDQQPVHRNKECQCPTR